MGIPSYFIHIVKNHRSILKLYGNNSTSKEAQKAQIKIDNLYLDSNSIIYDAIAHIEYINNKDFEDKILIAICAKLESYINIIRPSNKIFIAFDGVAPVAKLSQQKNRRYKSWFTEEIMKDINRKAGINSVVKKWNTASITPGTSFMEKLDEKIKAYFNNTDAISKYNCKEIIVSTSKAVGEGEHKIFKYIRDNAKYHSATSTAIYGLDSDLIMLTLNHLKFSQQLYLFRETPFFIKNLDASLEPNSHYLLDIPEFADKLADSLGMGMGMESDSREKQLGQEIKQKLISDYVFLFFLLGNDFMPHFPALNIRTNGIEVLLDIYRQVNSSLNNFIIEKDRIVWKNLRKIVEILAGDEHKLLMGEYAIRSKWESRKYQENTEEQKFMNTPIFVRNIEKFINPNESGWQSRYYKSLFHLDINDERRKQISINYLSILEWNFKYYNEGCPDWRFKYNYAYPPLFQDLFAYIPYFDTDLLDKTNEKRDVPINEFVQLAYVLPRNSLGLLPQGAVNILLNKFNEYYRLDYDFEWAFCKFFWECHVLMPEIEIAELERVFAKL